MRQSLGFLLAVLVVGGCAQKAPPDPGMVYVPAGEFVMGSLNGEADEAPESRVFVPAFWIAKEKVTNQQFATFLSETGQKARKLRGRPKDPVTGIAWSDARDYCAWASRPDSLSFRLPSEAEWEKAARGSDGRRYPWGDSWNAGRIHSPSPFGCRDMVGLTWEWCSSKYAAYPYQSGDGRESLEDLNAGRVVRGGSAHDHPTQARCSNRFRLFLQPTLDNPFLADTGFRVAASDPAATPASATPALPLKRREAPYFQMLTSEGDRLPPEESDRKYRLGTAPQEPGRMLGYPLTHEREMRYFAPIEHFVGLSTDDRRQSLFALDRYLKVRKGQVVADLGTGSGVFLTYLSQAVGPSGEVWATEISASPLKCVQAWINPAPAGLRPEEDLYYFVREIPRPEAKTYLVLHDLNDCLLRPASLDLACLIQVHYFYYPHAKKGVSPPLAQVVKYYRSVARSLKPGGKVAILDYSEFNPTTDPDHGVLSAAEIADQMRHAGLELILQKDLLRGNASYAEISPTEMRVKRGKRNVLLLFRLVRGKHAR